jgi:DNA-directed RNA polymerase specialized sigma24 family protein
MGGSDGDQSRTRTNELGLVVVAKPQERRNVGRSGRAPSVGRTYRRLTEAEREEVQLRHRISNYSLRDLATEYGVSHETIRSVLRNYNGNAVSPTSTGQHVNIRKPIGVG